MSPGHGPPPALTPQAVRTQNSSSKDLGARSRRTPGHQADAREEAQGGPSVGCWGRPRAPTGTAGPGGCAPRGHALAHLSLPMGLSRSPSQGVRKAAVLMHSTGARPGDGQAGALGGLPSACEAGARALEEGRAGRRVGSGSGRRPRPLLAPRGLVPGVGISLVQGWGSEPPLLLSPPHTPRPPGPHRGQVQ